MSLISGYLNQTGQVKREDAAVFFDGPAAASLEPLLISGIGGDGFMVKVRKSDGEAVAHTVTVSGTLEGSPVEETLNFSAYASQTKYTTSYFDTITSIVTTMGGEDPLPNLRCVAVDEGHVEITATTWESFACRWEEKAVPYWDDVGSFILSDAKVICEEEIEAGDYIRLYPDDSIIGHEVKSVKPATGLGGTEEFRTLLL